MLEGPDAFSGIANHNCGENEKYPKLVKNLNKDATIEIVKDNLYLSYTDK